MSKPSPLLLRHKWALGDTVLLTALVRDIHRAYPGRFQIGVDTAYTPVWLGNPNVVPFEPGARPHRLIISWAKAITNHGIAQNKNGSNELKHILAWYHHDFERQTGLNVPVTEPRGELYLQADEDTPIVEGRYWLILSGGKLDITNKHWDVARYQTVVDTLSALGIRFVQTGATTRADVHPPLKNVLNLVGQAEGCRKLFNLIKHADGLICPVTGPMHIAAIYQKPCVVIAGSREEPWFEAYTDAFKAFGTRCDPVRVPHRFLHTTGMLPCHPTGCWKRRTVPLDPSDRVGKRAKELCLRPEKSDSGQDIAQCMSMITVEHVVQAVLSYYWDGTLPILPPMKLTSPCLQQNQAKMDHYDPKTLPSVAAPTLLTLPNGATYEFKQISGPKPVSRPDASFDPSAAPRIDNLTVPQPQTPVAVAPEGIKLTKLPSTEVIGPDFNIPQAFMREKRTTEPLYDNLDVLDNPSFGGKVTICVLCYGDHADLARKCIGGILNTVPRHRLSLRIAANSVCQETWDYIQSVQPDALYQYIDNRRKYPVMRDMFWDPNHPIDTKYVIWFDDDAMVMKNTWLHELAAMVIANHKHGTRLYGSKMFHDLKIYQSRGGHPEQWFRQADWYRGINFRIRGTDRLAPNGSCVDFVKGFFWALGTDALRAGNIPDIRLGHNGGDIAIGAQVHQAGYKIVNFDSTKSLVWCPGPNSGGHRGVREPFLWAP